LFSAVRNDFDIFAGRASATLAASLAQELETAPGEGALDFATGQRPPDRARRTRRCVPPRGRGADQAVHAVMARFHDRRDAGRFLARKLLALYAGRPDVLVLALPRGGVPVGYEVARALQAPLDVFLVRKLGMPGHEEYALGAIASGGVRVLNEKAANALGIPQSVIDAVTGREERELERRSRAYRGGRAPPDVRGRTVILVDDGLATGASMQAAVQALRRRGPARIVVAVPAAPRETCKELRKSADEVICAIAPEFLRAVGYWYEDFSKTSDEEVRRLLHYAWADQGERLHADDH
jgi:predicted phosphoribosyltransferase